MPKVAMTNSDCVPQDPYSKSGDKNLFDPSTTEPVLRELASWARAQRSQMTFKCVHLSFIDSQGRAVRDSMDRPRVATGFLRREAGVLFLYTCWHVVTGIDFLHPKLPPVSEPRRTRLQVTFQLAASESPGVSRIAAGRHTFSVPLYEDESCLPAIPRWEQSVACRDVPEIDAAGLRVPFRYDMVRLDLTGLDLPFLTSVQMVDITLWTHAIDPGDRLFVAGFPFGFTGDGEDIEAVLLSRMCAESSWKNTAHGTFLDSPCAPGMSGSPVLLEMGSHLFLAGLYTGARFPEGPTDRPDRLAALGTFCPFAIPLMDGQLVPAKALSKGLPD